MTDPEDRALSLLLVATMGPIAILAGLSREGFGGGATLALVLAVLGAAGLARQLRAAPGLPRARTLRRARRAERSRVGP